MINPGESRQQGLGVLAQGVRSVDERSDLPGFSELLQSGQILFVRQRNERVALLAHEQ